METVEIKRMNRGHVFERCITSNPVTIANTIKEYIFVKSFFLADGTVIANFYKHRKFEHETMMMKFL